MVQSESLTRVYDRDNEDHVEGAEYRYAHPDGDGSFSGDVALISGRADWTPCEYLVYAHAYALPGLYGDDEYLRAFTTSFSLAEAIIEAFFQKSMQSPPPPGSAEYNVWSSKHIL